MCFNPQITRTDADSFFATKKNTFFFGFCNPLFADFQFVSGKNFANVFRRVAIGKEKPDGFAGAKSKLLVFDFNLPRAFEMESGDNSFQAN